uniref:Putative secreted protein n=1 Tax=Ixodes scapularis TaxID=6945 RepID=A0A4D5S138_IXOSC
MCDSAQGGHVLLCSIFVLAASVKTFCVGAIERFVGDLLAFCFGNAWVCRTYFAVARECIGLTEPALVDVPQPLTCDRRGDDLMPVILKGGSSTEVQTRAEF